MIQNYFKINKLCNIFIALLLTDITSVKLLNSPQGVGGINGVSFAGGCAAMISKSSNSPVQQCSVTYSGLGTLAGLNQGVPFKLEDAYQSEAANGKLAFSTAPCTQIIPGSDMDDLISQESASFNIGVYDPQSIQNDGNDDNPTSSCPSSSSSCRVVYSRAFTPLLHYQSPRAIYDGQEVGFYIDPKQCMDYRERDNLNQFLEKPFLYATVNGQNIDFKGFVDSNSPMSSYSSTFIRGTYRGILANPQAAIVFNFKCGNALVYKQATQCKFDDNTTCYEAKVLPSIKSVNYNCGYRTGGQIITIQGSGFNGKTIDIKIDGVPCDVQKSPRTSTTLVCKTGANPSPSNLTYYVGSPGIRKSYFNAIGILSGKPSSEMISTGFETPYISSSGYAQNISRGYFRPPITGNYKFYMSCDDSCDLFLSTSQDPSQKKKILSITSWVNYRSYFTADGSQNTSWIPLIGGQYYYIESKHTQASGQDHMTVAVEIEGTQSQNHPQQMKEIQRLKINQTNVREKIAFNFTNFTNYPLFISISNNMSKLFNFPSPINPRSTAAQFQSAIQAFWNTNYGSLISVTLTMYDRQFNVTTNASASYCNYFVVTVNRPLPFASKSFKSYSFTKNILDKSTILTISSLQVSSPPLSGSFVLSYTLPGGTTGTTGAIPWNAHPNTIKYYLEQTFIELKDKLIVWDAYASGNYEDGRDIFIRFVSYNDDPDQITISSAVTPAITGGDPLVPTTYVSETFVPYSTNQFYEPIPYEFLFTNESSPQIEVTIDGERAVCASLNCGYKFCDSNVMINGFSLSGYTLTITGVNFNVLSIIVNFAQQNCKVNKQVTTTSMIVCSLPSHTAGYWYPVVSDDKGYLPMLSGLQKLYIPLIVTSVTPNSVLNVAGGKQLEIQGDNFPSCICECLDNTFFITFEDGSICLLEYTSPTLIRCMTQEYKGNISQPVTMCITINNITDCSLKVTFVPPEIVVTSISPRVASPVLPAKITFNYWGDYSGTLVAEELDVTIVEKTNSSHTRKLRVVSVDNNAQTFLVKYNGIEAGEYFVIVDSTNHGRFNTTGITFTSIGIITDYNPKNGSIYGGTVITISGYNFSNDFITDNAVHVGYTPCNVLTTSYTQITCMTQQKKVSDPLEDDVIVFLRTFYEADCAFGLGNCTYTWLTESNLPNLTSYSVAFDTTLNDYVLTLVGEGFPTDPSEVKFFVDGVQQTVTSSSDSLITITISGLLNSFSRDIQFYLPSGTPNGAKKLRKDGITLTPVLISTSPSVGSPAGTTITAIIKGVGVNTANVFIATNFTGSSICASVKIPSYGVVKCTTKVANIIQSTLRVSAVSSSTFYNCATPSQCQYITSANYPAVTSQTQTSTSIVFTGTNFFTSGFNASASLKGMLADQVSIDSDTSATATWLLGIPVLAAGTIPQLWFDGGEAGVHWALNSNQVLNPLTVTEIDSQVTCSFEGGCQIAISQVGVTTAVTLGNSYVSICGNRAVLSSLSTPSQAIFTLPTLQTSYSMQYLSISEEQRIVGTTFSSEPSAIQTNGPWNGDTVNGFLSTKTPCFFGTSFKAGYVGLVTQVKFYIYSFVQSQFIGKLRFQGSFDGDTYDDIFVAGSEIHEGWNYYDFTGFNTLQYRFYRFYSNGSAGTCNIGEVVLRGFEVIEDYNPTYQCQAQLFIDGAASPITLDNVITYDTDQTPQLHSISPRFGPVQGGTEVKFSGDGFVSDPSLYTITIDGIDCPALVADTNSVTCVTKKRPGLVETSLTIFIQGKGLVSTKELVFRYMNYWSNTQTWGDDFIPMDGETIVIPKGLNLLVDIDHTPLLNAIDVEGSLIFPPHDDPTHERTFDANIIVVKGGYLEIGTEEFPYTSKLTITMHGEKYSPVVPIFGNKAIGAYGGTIDIHGVPRYPTWTELLTTAYPLDTTITLNTAVDWQIGEQIVIAPSSYDNTETEVRTIIFIDNVSNPDQPVLTLDEPLEFLHFAGIDTYGDDFIEMRSEVGLLTRNILFRGDPETSPDNQYGANILLYSKKSDPLVGRIEYVELQYVGQAFQKGKYPILFHVHGDASQSYVRGTSIHDSYNRAIALHGVFSLTLDWNVIFMVKGHAIFFENAAEAKNKITNNLVMRVHASFSLLDTDTTPACFWITHPDNIFRGNHAVASDGKGFWFDTKQNSRGHQASINICPENNHLAEFTNNVAHSNLQHGLQIFRRLIPRRDQCSALIYDANNVEDPYWKNPIITAQFVNFTSWKNTLNGAIFERIGDVRLINFKVADNLVAGIEVSQTRDTPDGTAQIQNALVIGSSVNAEAITTTASSRGIITPRTENFQVNGANFYNFQLINQAAFGTCSQCFNPVSTDSGARTITTSLLQFDPSSVLRRIIYQFPQRDIFYDKDGSLTDIGPETFATFYYPHNDQPECDRQELILNGLRCNSSVQVRRIAFYGNVPWIIFTSQPINILKWDDSITSPLDSTGLDDYIKNISAYSRIPFRGVSDLSGWAVPYVTGHKYKISFGSGPLDWTYIVVDQSIRWKKRDEPVLVVMNFTDVRAEVLVTAGGQRIDNYTLSNKTDPDDWQSGDNDILNDTETREIRFVLNGKNKSKSNIVMTGARCAGGPCIAPLPPTVPTENFTRRWSDPNSWTVGTVQGVVPKENDTVTIPEGWNMIYDVGVSPILTYLEINGILTFENNGNMDLTLRSQYIFVRAGQLIIGNSTNPFLKNANIILYGEYSQREIVFVNAIEGGNKILANTNLLSFYGKQRQQYTRLRESAYKDDTSILVERNLDWSAGDRIAIAPNTLNTGASDYAIVVSYDPATGNTTLDRNLSHYHWGQDTSTVPTYKIDMRAEVVLLTRNIRIQGDVSTNSWGCSVLTSDFPDGTYQRNGITIFDNVEIFNCSQYDTLKAALRFDGANLGFSSITNSSIYQGWGMGVTITSSSNILIQNTNIFSFVRFGILIQTQSKRITLDQNVLFQVYDRRLPALDAFVDITAGIGACAAVQNDQCTYNITNNIVSAAKFAGYVVYGHDCGNYNQKVFKNNIAHSVDGSGAVIFPEPGNQNQLQCMEGSFFYAYKNRYDGAVSSFATPTIKYSNMIFIDNGIGPQPIVGMEGDTLWSKMQNITIWGETVARDCPYQGYCTNNYAASCVNRTGFMLPQFVNGAKLPMPISTFDLPMHRNDRPASFGGNIIAINMNFKGFQSGQTWCGSTQILFGLNGLASDYQPKAVIRNSFFENIHDDAFAYFYTPPKAWANLNDCGDWPCSGPNNTYLRVENSQFLGTKPVSLIATDYFQLTPLHVQGVKNFSTCTQVTKWNTYQCQNDDLAILLFESLDTDKWRRIASPISISQALIKSNTTINSFMDHGWSGPQTSQLRLSRWPSIIQVGSKAEQHIAYTGTPPDNQRFKLITDSLEGTIITIKYPKSGVYNIIGLDGTTVSPNKWNDTLKGVNPIQRSYCGENRYEGVVNLFQFYLTSNCLVKVVPIDAIASQIRLEWTLKEFYDDGGATAFCDRMAASLGIKSYDIKVVAVFYGSVYINYQVTDSGRKYNNLKTLSLQMIKLINTNQLNVGAPILSANIGYAPIIIPSTTSQTTNSTTNTTSSKIIVTNLNGTASVETQSSTSSESGISSKTLIIILAALAGILLIGAGLIGYWFYRKNMLRLKQVHQDGQTIIDELDQYAKIKASESARTNTLYMTEEFNSGI